MADRFTDFRTSVDASSGASNLPPRRRRRWRASAFGLLAALLGLVGVFPAPASASAPVNLYGIAPNAGPNTGGITVSVAGAGFQPGATLKICNVSVAGSGITSTHMTAVVPNISPSYGACSAEVDNTDGGQSPEHVAFNSYEQLPSMGAVSAAGAAIHALPGPNDAQTDVFVKGVDTNLHHTFHSNIAPAWSAGENLGGVLTSAPTAVSWGGENRIDVFVRGSDNALWHKWWDGSTWSGWEGLGGILTADPVVTSWSTGRLDVFGRGSDNQLWHIYYAGSWSGWEPLGGFLASGTGPGGVSWGANRIDVFVHGSDQALWHKWWDGSTWSGWEWLGGAISLSPAATSRGVGDVEVYALELAATRNLYHRSYSGGWLSWRAEGPYWNGAWGFSPGVASQGFVIGPDVFMVGGEKTAWHGITFGPRVGFPSSKPRRTR